MTNVERAREQRHHILVVDDEEMSVELLRRTFDDQPDILVTATTSPCEALAVARRKTVDLVITDQRMPGMHGVDFIVELRKLQPETVPIILTAYPELSLVIRALNDAQVYKFLTKPCDPDSIQLTVRRALEAIELKRENVRLTARLQRQNCELAHALDVVESAHAELVRSEKMAMIGRLSAGLVHELSTPVTVLQVEHRTLQSVMDTLVHLLERLEEFHLELRESVSSESRRARLLEIVDEARRAVNSGSAQQAIAVCARAVGSMRSLLSSLKTYSHPGFGRREAWDAKCGIESALQILRHRLGGRISVVREYGEVPAIQCAGQEIGQVLLNLLSNAIDASELVSPAPCEIHVRTMLDSDGRRVRIGISDNGCGMDEETQSKLFQPFFTTKPIGTGTGLGLSISRHIIESHHGRIEVDSRPGHGTCMWIVLPIDSHPESPASEPILSEARC